MRLDRHFQTLKTSEAFPDQVNPMPLNAFTFGPMGSAARDQWAAIYRVAYERTVEALRPTPYDRAMQACAN